MIFPGVCRVLGYLYSRINSDPRAKIQYIYKRHPQNRVVDTAETRDGDLEEFKGKHSAITQWAVLSVR
jgi:hypothetical protein